MFRILINTLFCLAIIIISLNSNGLNENNQKPYKITANQIIYDIKTQTITYIGNVHAKQGLNQASSNKMTIYHNPKTQTISHIILTGTPATYHAILENGNTLNAEAKKIEYVPNTHKIQLTQHAKIKDNRTYLLGEHLEYDLETQTLSSYPVKKKSITKIIIEPGAFR